MPIVDLAAALVDLVLPADCPGCGGPPGPGPSGVPWCPACAARLAGPVRLALPGGPPGLAAGRYRGPLRAALLRYKERGRGDLATPLARLLLAPLDELSPPECAWLVPAPSRRSAARARGGDHVLRLARALAAARPGVRVARGLALGRGARDSVGLDAGQRAANLAGRVRVREAGLPPPGTGILLLDDVVTTGATLHACGAVLAGHGRPVRAALVLCDATTPPGGAS